jgi:hypothetical protein
MAPVYVIGQAIGEQSLASVTTACSSGENRRNPFADVLEPCGIIPITRNE